MHFINIQHFATDQLRNREFPKHKITKDFLSSLSFIPIPILDQFTIKINYSDLWLTE